MSSAHSSPFLLDNTSLSLCASDSESSDSSPELDFDPSRCPSVDVHSVTSSEAVLSTGWMFSGNFVVDKRDPYAEFSMDDIDDLFESKSKSVPVFLDHMTIFTRRQVTVITADHKYSVSLRGYIYGKRTSMSVWMKWLGQKLLWTPLSNVGLSDEYQADCSTCEDGDADWFVLGRYGKRKQFQVFCKSFYFETAVEIDIPASSSLRNDDLLQLVQTTFLDSINRDETVNFQSKGCKFVLVLCDGLELFAASPGSTQRVNLLGFIQCLQTDLCVWKDYFEARWYVAREGLCGLVEFENARAEDSNWVQIYKLGELGKNNQGRNASRQARFVPPPLPPGPPPPKPLASGVRSHAPHCRCYKISFMTSAPPPPPPRSVAAGDSFVRLSASVFNSNGLGWSRVHICWGAGSVGCIVVRDGGRLVIVG